MQTLKWILVLLLVIAAAVLGIALANANPQTAEIDLLFAKFEWSLIGMLAVELVVVLLLSFFFFALRLAWLKRKVRRLEKQVDARDAELSAMRNLPVTQG